MKFNEMFNWLGFVCLGAILVVFIFLVFNYLSKC